MHDSDTHKKMQKRLKRAEGQVAAIRRMLDEEAPCLDVLVQISAAQGALSKAAQVLLSAHIENCVESTFQAGDAEEREKKVSELMHIFSRYGHLGAR